MCGDNLGNILIFYPREKARHMFHLNEVSYEFRFGDTIQIYELNKILEMNYDTLGAIVHWKCHLNAVISIKWLN